MRVFTALVFAAAVVCSCSPAPEPKTPAAPAATTRNRQLTEAERSKIETAVQEACLCRRRMKSGVMKAGCNAELERLTAGLQGDEMASACYPVSDVLTCYSQPNGESFCVGTAWAGDVELCTSDEVAAVNAVPGSDSKALERVLAKIRSGRKAEVGPPADGNCGG